MEFQYDPAKSQSNKEKHGIDFIEAEELWHDEDRLQIPAKSETELRFGLIAQRGNKIWIAFYTEREGLIRLISVRRARVNEEQAYDGGRTR